MCSEQSQSSSRNKGVKVIVLIRVSATEKNTSAVPVVYIPDVLTESIQSFSYSEICVTIIYCKYDYFLIHHL